MTDLLIVDDELFIRDAMTVRIEALGYSVSTVGSTEEMWEFFKKEIPKGIVLDIMLPYRTTDEIDLDAGIEDAKELARKYPKIPVILITGRGDTLPDEVAKKLGNVVAFFRKPVPGQQLRNVIEKIMKE